MRLLDERTLDGSRHFACLPRTVAWEAVCNHVRRLPGAKPINVIVGGPAPAWLDFEFRTHRFLIDARNGSFRLIVQDPQCCDLVLYEVGCHFERLLSDSGRPSCGGGPS
jgi:hypothetical protein